VHVQVSALVIIDMTWQYWVLTAGLVGGGGVLFWIMMFIGEKLVQVRTDRKSNFLA
jgi:hypothetical protein